ncbi:type IX secretion system ring subunit PorN/GldN [Pedobacter nutrimenti]|uniref:Gliding motility associated protein GldN n=1 Tax=Pedobacter nutrimenti TaxID=1241337 RepID=A0A318U971_9SPHI|nr:gliding motility protein GldN [Pedobacter nutrimenti]PYF68426.1 gliding motility associated protein GldN [Pedobacter nutrimenti]
MKKIIITTLSIAITSICFGQNLENPKDGYFLSKDFKNAKPTPYTELKSSDVGSVRRIWRDIDLTKPENKFFQSSQSRLIDILLDGVMQEKLVAYSATTTKDNPSGDAFITPLSIKDALAKFSDSVSVPVYDDNGNEVKRVMKQNDFNPDAITKFRLKEDWIFNKKTGVVEPRIIGIAPLIRIEAAGETINEQPAFWLNFPEARNILATIPVTASYTTDYSYDDIFILRKFKSIIIKEASPDNLRLVDYVKNGDLQAESDRIETSLKTEKSGSRIQ